MALPYRHLTRHEGGDCHATGFCIPRYKSPFISTTPTHQIAFVLWYVFAWTCALLVNCPVVSPAVQHGAPHSQTCRLVPLSCMDMREIELLKSKTLAYVT